MTQTLQQSPTRELFCTTCVKGSIRSPATQVLVSSWARLEGGWSTSLTLSSMTGSASWSMMEVSTLLRQRGNPVDPSTPRWLGEGREGRLRHELQAALR